VVGDLCDALICVSGPVARQAAAYAPAVRLEIVADGFDQAAFLARPIAPRVEVLRRHGLPPERRLLVCLGGLQRRKGQLDLVEAMALLPPPAPPVTALLCGPHSEPEYVDHLARRIAELELTNVVRISGMEPDPRSLLAHAELLVQPSHSEGFGLAILEAMAIGLPVVATRCGGPEETVVDGESGLLVPVENPKALAAAISRLLAEESLARRLGRGAADRAAIFSGRSGALRLGALYDELLGRWPPVPADRAGRARQAAGEVEARLAALAAG